LHVLLASQSTALGTAQQIISHGGFVCVCCVTVGYSVGVEFSSSAVQQFMVHVSAVLHFMFQQFMVHVHSAVHGSAVQWGFSCDCCVKVSRVL
jgi:hypothetical protein